VQAFCISAPHRAVVRSDSTVFLFTLLALHENNLLTDCQYYRIVGYTVHDYLFAQKVTVLGCFEEQSREMSTSWWDGLRSTVGYGLNCEHGKSLLDNKFSRVRVRYSVQ